jgi:hypothetical protein
VWPIGQQSAIFANYRMTGLSNCCKRFDDLHLRLTRLVTPACKSYILNRK